MNDRNAQQGTTSGGAWEGGPDAFNSDTEQQQARASALLADFFGEPIDVYSRAQALADGVLFEATPSLCAEAGFMVPVALTAAAWADCVAWTEADDERQDAVQDQTGRLWDVLWMTRYAISRAPRGTVSLTVDLDRVPCDGRSSRATTVRLIADIGPGDDGEPVITIMQPHES
ncbi:MULTISPECIES: DUF6573 family protein [Streptacidiphilus]|uniref:DUF6573 family protein n=1 Tax=Streptacidiphilus cavernicola TaxID=3342716 RepID=A0ABV6UWT3_9ACTN|nr:DUF6573 family protein [Streptacidiphilus jeojiense]